MHGLHWTTKENGEHRTSKVGVGIRGAVICAIFHTLLTLPLRYNSYESSTRVWTQLLIVSSSLSRVDAFFTALAASCRGIIFFCRRVVLTICSLCPRVLCCSDRLFCIVSCWQFLGCVNGFLVQYLLRRRVVLTISSLCQRYLAAIDSSSPRRVHKFVVVAVSWWQFLHCDIFVSLTFSLFPLMYLEFLRCVAWSWVSVDTAAHGPELTVSRQR